MPWKTPAPVCRISESLPCTGTGARITLPPKAWPMAWWPRQTPKIGMCTEARLIRSRQMPASLGVHGPGDSTIASGSRASDVIDADLIIAMDIDLRPQAAQVMDEVEGEAVIVVDQQDHDPRLSPQSGLI